MVGFGVKTETCSCCKQKKFEISVGVSLLLKKQAVEMLTGFECVGIRQVAYSGRSCLVAGSSVSWWTTTVLACWVVCKAHCTSRMLSEIAWRWWCMTPCTLVLMLGRNLLSPSWRCKQPTRCHIPEDSLKWTDVGYYCTERRMRSLACKKSTVLCLKNVAAV